MVESLPSLTGDTTGVHIARFSVRNGDTYGSGVLRHSYSDTHKWAGGNGGFDGCNLSFDASRVSSIYSGSHVTPLSKRVRFLIRF